MRKTIAYLKLKRFYILLLMGLLIAPLIYAQINQEKLDSQNKLSKSSLKGDAKESTNPKKPAKGFMQKGEEENILNSITLSQTLATTKTLSKSDLTSPALVKKEKKGSKKKESDLLWVTLPNGIKYQDIYVGTGKSPKYGVSVYCHFKGYFEDGTEFDNTFKRRQFFCFTYGKNEVLEAFELGIETMKEKGKRKIIIPSELAFGDKGYKDDVVQIKPNSTLIFEVSLMWIREPEQDKLGRFK